MDLHGLVLLPTSERYRAPGFANRTLHHTDCVSTHTKASGEVWQLRTHSSGLPFLDPVAAPCDRSRLSYRRMSTDFWTSSGRHGLVHKAAVPPEKPGGTRGVRPWESGTVAGLGAVCPSGYWRPPILDAVSFSYPRTMTTRRTGPGSSDSTTSGGRADPSPRDRARPSRGDRSTRAECARWYSPAARQDGIDEAKSRHRAVRHRHRSGNWGELPGDHRHRRHRLLCLSAPGNPRAGSTRGRTPGVIGSDRQSVRGRVFPAQTGIP